MLFQPDLFSASRPGWVEVDSEMALVLDEVLSGLPQAFRALKGAPEQSDALGLNSKNFRLNTPEGKFVLKRWSRRGVLEQDIHDTLGIMDWLASELFPVPAPVRLEQGRFTLSNNSGIWSLFPFVEGNYFSGVGDELNAAAEVTGSLMVALAQLPSKYVPMDGPSHLSVADGELLSHVWDISARWDKVFGTRNAEQLSLSWPLLIAEWRNLNSAGLSGGRLQAAHFDLHPHNLLFNADEVVAVLDFEACKVIPVGVALGFAALKQCRQALALGLSSSDPRSVGSFYADILWRACPSSREIIEHLGDLTVAEILRRICIILRLNVERGDTRWNKVLGTQIAHLSEARALFG